MREINIFWQTKFLRHDVTSYAARISLLNYHRKCLWGKVVKWRAPLSESWFLFLYYLLNQSASKQTVIAETKQRHEMTLKKWRHPIFFLALMREIFQLLWICPFVSRTGTDLHFSNWIQRLSSPWSLHSVWAIGHLSVSVSAESPSCRSVAISQPLSFSEGMGEKLRLMLCELAPLFTQPRT